MSVRKIFGVGLVFLAMFLVGLRVWIVNTPDEKPVDPPPPPKLYLDTGEQKTMEINATEPGWTLVAHGPITIESYGLINVGGLDSDPRGNVNRPGDANTVVPNLPYGALLAKVGENGQPFAVEWYAQISMREMIYVAINDSDYSDNTGTYTVVVTGGRK